MGLKLINQINEREFLKTEVLTLIVQGAKRASLMISSQFDLSQWKKEMEQQGFLGAVIHFFSSEIGKQNLSTIHRTAALTLQLPVCYMML